MKIAQEKVVSIHYTLKNAEGSVLDSSSGADPLAYLHGAGNIIPGLESALEGKQAGEKLSVTVEPGQGYGERDERLVQDVPRTAFKGVQELAPGMQFQAQGPQGTRIVVVTKVAEETVTVDANHPLAGQDLTFELELVEIL